jgi:hypothetical protein
MAIVNLFSDVPRYFVLSWFSLKPLAVCLKKTIAFLANCGNFGTPLTLSTAGGVVTAAWSC